MKATIDFDKVLYQRLKIEAARRGRTVKDLVSEGVRLILSRPQTAQSPKSAEKPPAWLGDLKRYAKKARISHDMESVRRSIARGRKGEKR
jgi:hypothetical protein